MKLSEIVRILDAEILCTAKGANRVNISMGCGADLMSDVLAFIKAGTLLLTGLTTPQVIYTAENAGIEVVCFVRGKMPHSEVLTLAKQKGIVLIATKDSMFQGCGKLYREGLTGCFDVDKKTRVSSSLSE